MAKQFNDLLPLFYTKDQYFDDYGFRMSHHFEEREKAITNYIKNVSDSYRRKSIIKNVFQILIASILLIAIVSFAVVFIILIFTSTERDEVSVNTIISLIGSVSAFISSIFGLLLIIVKYIFPMGDDELSMDFLKQAIKTDKEYYDADSSMKKTPNNDTEKSDK